MYLAIQELDENRRAILIGLEQDPPIRIEEIAINPAYLPTEPPGTPEEIPQTAVQRGSEQRTANSRAWCIVVVARGGWWH